MADHHSPPLSPKEQAGTESPLAAKTPKVNSKTHGIELTPVESLLFFNIIRFNQDNSAVDWEQVAIHSNLKNASSAKVRFRQIQKKYDLENASKPTTKATATPKTPATQKSGKRKRKVENEVNDDGEDNGVTDDTPSKKQKQPSRKRQPATGGRKNGKAKDKEQTTGTDAGSVIGAVDRGVRVKDEPGVHDEGSKTVGSLAGADYFADVSQHKSAGGLASSMSSIPHRQNLRTDVNLAQVTPHGGLHHLQQPLQVQGQHQHPGYFDQGFHPGNFQQYHMSTGQFGQLGPENGGFYVPSMNHHANSTAHGFSQGGRNDQQTDSRLAGPLLREDEQI